LHAAEGRKEKVPRTLVVTGTGTGVGKTVLGRLLIGHLLARGCPVRAFKPLCSGGRDDARALWHAQRRALPLSIVNPWWFAEPVTPLVAARHSGVVVRLAEVCSHVRQHSPAGEVILVEGAGGLLSPLGIDFSSRELITALAATPIIVAINRLGLLNESLLTWEALPAEARLRACWVLFEPPIPDASSPSNPEVLAERLGADRIHRLPRLTGQRLRRPDSDLSARLELILSQAGIPFPSTGGRS